MRQHVTFYLLVVLASVALSQNTERSCPCTYGGIWLDIVAVIDNSQAMTTAGLAQVAATFATIVGQVNISQALGQYTRVSLISFSNSATVVGNLTTYRNIDELIAAIYSISLSGVNALNIEAGLQAAGQVLALPRSDRANVKTVIVLFSSAYSSGGFTDPLPAANQLKEGGIPIITVAFTQADTGSQVNQIAALASPGFAVNSTDTNVIAEIFQNLCQVNCFCPANWFQMTDNYDRPTRKFGECLRYQDIEAAWTPAKFACQNELNGGFLYQEFSFQKHNFVQRLVNNTSTYNGNGQWHIGLSYDGGSNQYYWEGANGQVLLGSYQPWAPGYPQEAYGNAIGNADGQWRNNRDLTYVGRYVCQAATCDTDTYCAAV